MTNPGHLLVSFRGKLGASLAGATESYSFGLRFAEFTGGVWSGYPAPTQPLADECFTRFKSLITGAGMFCEYVWAEEVRLYGIGTDGHAIDTPIISAWSGAGQGTSGTHLPFQCSQVVSLKASGLGKGKRGRFYLPPQGQTPGNDGLLTTAQQTITSNAAVSFINGIVGSATLTTPARLAVIGRTGADGTARAVTHVSVGRVIDTQRRRRRSLDEGYVEALTYTDYALAA